MKIMVMAHNLLTGGGAVVGKNIMANLPVVAPNHEYLMVCPAGLGYEQSIERGDGIQIELVRNKGFLHRAFFETRNLNKMVRAFGPDLIWGLGNFALKRPGCRQALLLHEAHLFYPKRHYGRVSTTHGVRYTIRKHRLQRCLPSVDTVFCQTETARRRFAESFSTNARIRVCPNAVSDFVNIPQEVQEPDVLRPYRDRFKLFFLAAGVCPHRNFEAIVEVFTRHRKQLQDVVCVLTIDRSQGKLSGPFLDEIRRLELDDCIVNVGPLTQRQLATYYLSCECLFLPTLLESFSGTYLESMQFGRPILTSDLDFAHDVCGNAAHYFDPWDADSIADSICELRDNASLRETLVACGRDRLKTAFQPWPNVVREALNDMNVPL